MSRTLLMVAAATAVAVSLSATALGRPAATPKLKGTVGPSFTISLTANGKRVKTLKPGAYTFVIADKASIHNFVLEQESGGKFEKALTSVSFVGTKSVKVTLKKGKWKFYCMPHESTMFGSFTVK